MKWIDIKQETPALYEEALTINVCGNYHVGEWYSEHPDIIEPEFRFDSPNAESSDVTHWMRLPPAPHAPQA